MRPGSDIAVDRSIDAAVKFSPLPRSLSLSVDFRYETDDPKDKRGRDTCEGNGDGIVNITALWIA